MPKLFLLDAYALIYRAYYALLYSRISNSRGENNGAILGFVNTLDDVIRRENPDYLGIAFDPAGPTFRHERYPEYKAQREATPEDIHRAVPYIKRIIEAYRIPILEVSGFEADDVIGTLARQGEAAGLDVYMFTPDKDYAQLVTDHIFMCRPGKNGLEILGPTQVCEKYNVSHPAQVIDLLGLMGDKADNIPGCPGIGPVSAAKLINQFGSIEAMLSSIETIKGATRKKVEENVEQIRLSHELVVIRTDVPVSLDLEALRRVEPNKEALRTIFEELEFRRHLENLGFNTTTPTKTQKNITPQPSLFDTVAPEFTNVPKETTHKQLKNIPHDYQLIESDVDAKKLCEFLLTKQEVAFDTETTSLNPFEAQLVGLSFAITNHRAWYVAVPHETEAAQRRVDIFRPLYENEQIAKVAQNAKYDLTVLGNYGIQLRGTLFDTMLAHYLVQPELYHNMDYLAEVYLNYRTIHIEELIGPKGRKQKNMADLSPAEICNYACEDADVTLCLATPLRQEMKENGLTRIFNEIESPLLPVLARMERNGVCLDLKGLAETGKQFNQRMETLETEIYKLAGHSFSLTSPKQVGEVLFDELKLSDKAKKTKKGQYSTAEEVLESIRAKHPIVEKILAHRALKKLLSTYIEALPKLINPHTHHIHTSFNQAVTATGRLSSSNPNLQNIPVRGEDGREIRRAFVPEPGEVFFSADYSQIELRIMAHLCGDSRMIADFCNGKDIHAATAARIFKKPLEEVSRDERSKAKTANFGIIYGISAFGLAERMNVSRTEAKELIDNYFATYPGVKNFIARSIKSAREKGYIETLFGRRRYLPDINSRNAVVRGYAERNAVNAPIQGTAADIIKLAMVRIDRRLHDERLQAKMILQVHDELNFSVSPTELPALKRLVIEEMENAYTMQVPLLADCGEGNNWLEAH